MIRQLHHIGIAVPDQTVADEYLSAFGLDTAEVGDALHARSAGRDHEEVVVVDGPTKRLTHVAFAVGADTLDDVKTRLRQRGVDRVTTVEGGLAIVDPDGNQVRLLAVDPSGHRALPTVSANSSGATNRVGEARWQRARDDWHPFRLGHSLIFTRDLDAMERFYIEVLGLRLSDRIIDKVVFLNAGPGDHHVFGFIHSTHPGLHHVSFEVTGIDAIAANAERMSERGHGRSWGIGRHSIGSNLFHYSRDPWGSWFEVYSDLDAIDDGWEASDWHMPPHIWGAPPPDDFLTNLEAPSLKTSRA